MTCLPEQMIFERKIEECDMDCMDNRLHINVLESRINVGDDELQFGEIIIHSPQELRVHLVAT